MNIDTAQLIATVAKAPPDCWDAIIAAARGKAKTRPGTIRQAAEILGAHPRTIQRYAKAGLLHAIRISPRRIRYDLLEVEKLATAGASGIVST
jgi:hypothetical protein